MTHKLLNIDWAHLFEGQDMDAMWLCFHTKLLNLIDKDIPTDSFNSKPKPKWLDLFTLKKITCAMCRTTTAVKYTKLSFETKLAKDIQQNSTLFWKYVRNNTKVRHDVDT